MPNFDIITVGGGAAGLFAAISAKKRNKNASVAVIERNDRVGKKLITTGNGRCNLSNSDLKNLHFHSSNPAFLSKALRGISPENTKEFFRSVGIETVTETDGRVFPASLQASSVVDALRFSLEELGVSLFTNCKITKITREKGGFTCVCDDTEFFSKAIILTTGGLAGGEKLGCDKTGYLLAESLGHKTVKPLPAITQIKTDTSVIRRFKGIKINAEITAKQNGKHLRKETGELLFCDYGISGPPIFQLSGAVSGKDNCQVEIDMLPEYGKKELVSLLTERRNILKNRDATEFFTGFINKRVGQYFVKTFANSAQKCGDITDFQIEKTVQNIKCFTLKVNGVSDFKNAQVTKGGIDCRDVDAATMKSLCTAGLFFAGEVLDVDGDCGGYNLQWALHSGIIAANSALEYLK